MSPSLRFAAVTTLACVLIVSAGCGSGCSPKAAEQPTVAEPVRPADPDLSTPESAVEAYTDWISYAYRVSDSDVASHAVSAYQQMRVDSYIELNRQKQRAIEQQLVDASYRVLEREEPTATVAGTEAWTYRYVSPDGNRYLGDISEVSYEVTYTVILEAARGWVVERVEVAPGADVE